MTIKDFFKIIINREANLPYKLRHDQEILHQLFKLSRDNIKYSIKKQHRMFDSKS